MYKLFKNHRGQRQEKARTTTTRTTAHGKNDRKKLNLKPSRDSPREIHLEKSLTPPKPKEAVIIIPSTPLCQGPRPLHRRDSYSTITTIEELEAASSSCVSTQITELSDGIPYFISFMSYSEESDHTIAASNMPLIKKANKFLPDSSNVGDFYGDDSDCYYMNQDPTTAFTRSKQCPPTTAHITRKSPRQLLNQMDSFTNRKRDGRPILKRGESMGLNALSPPLRAGTLSPPVRSLNGIGRRRGDRLEI